MSQSYKDKYLKYKKKYLILKRTYIGGGFNPNSPKQYRQHLVNQNDDNTMSANNELDDEDCAVCVEKLNINPEGDAIEAPILSKLFPCNHIFHQYCIDQLLNYNNKCPLCKTDIENIYDLDRDSNTWIIPVFNTEQPFEQINQDDELDEQINPSVRQLLEEIGDENYYPNLQRMMTDMNFDNIDEAREHWDFLVRMAEEDHL